MTKRRTYERTHPWLTFEIDLRRFSSDIWMRLGACASKCTHIAGAPLSPEVEKRLNRMYLVRGAFATTAIEGNTLTEDEVNRHLQGELFLPPSRRYLGREIDNVVDAFNTLTERIRLDGTARISPELIRWMNGKVLEGLQVDEGVVPGEFSKAPLVVGRYRCAPPEDRSFLIARLCKTLNEFPVDKEHATAYAILKAIFAHLYLVWIHPFGDGNGRTARLLEFHILTAASLPYPVTHLLSNYYNFTRSEYYRHLDQASGAKYGHIAFFDYAVEGLRDGLLEQIEEIRKQQISVSWVNFVHEYFEQSVSKADRRRRMVVLALTEHGPAAARRIPQLTPALTSEYHDKSLRTVSRDINALLDAELIIRAGDRIEANTSMIEAFLPWRNLAGGE